MSALIRFSTKHPVSVLMALLAVILLGAGSLLFLPVDLLPQLSVRKLLVATEYEGITAGEMRKMVTIPIEDSLMALKGMKTVRSLSRDGLSLVTVELHWGMDADIALVEAREIIDVCYETLPSQCKKPVASKIDASSGETLTIALSAKDGDLLFVRYAVDNDIKPRFQRVNGVGAVSVLGGEKEEIQISVYREKMESRQLTLEMIAEKLAQSNFEYPAGNIREGEKELLVKTAGLFTSLNDIANTPVALGETGVVKLMDIASISRGAEEAYSFFTYDGKPCIKIGVSKKQNASPLLVSRQIKDEIGRLQLLYGQSYDFQIIDDASLAVKDSIVSLAVSAGLGVLVTVLLIFYFFKSLRLSIILAGVVPLSAMCVFVLLFVCGKTLNSMSLAGITIGIGLVVDNGAVVLENLQKQLGKKGVLELETINAVVDEVKLSNMSSACTTAIVFIPVFFMKGLIHELFSDMALAIITSVMAAFFLSITYIPSLFVLIYKKEKQAQTENRLLAVLKPKYQTALEGLFQRRYLALVMVVACLLITLISLPFINYELITQTQDNRIQAEMVFPYGTRVPYLEETADAIYNRLKTEPYIENLYLSGGIEKDDYLSLASPYAKAEKIVINLTIDTSQMAVKDAKQTLAAFFSSEQGIFSFTPKRDILAEIFDTLLQDSFMITADTSEESLLFAEQYAKTTDEIVPHEKITEFVFTPNRLSHARFQISAMYSASIVHNSLEGLKSAPYYERGREIPVKIKFFDRYIAGRGDVESLGVLLENGTQVPLRTLGSITVEQNEKVLYRYNRKDAKIIKNIRDDTPAAVRDFYIINPSKEQVREMMVSGGALLLGALVLLYLIMGAQFESFLIPLVFLLSLPPAFSGAFLFLAIFRKPLDMNSIIALVILFGISVNNAIILYESCMLRAKKTLRAITSACIEKFRAILITSSTTIFALVPFAIDPFNKSTQSSLALVLIGGMLVSTCIVLFVVPVILSILFKSSEAT
ncbi:multidrug ABC transporter [Spirochaetia bacterium]|nr:multidrug ABC transporter [Spirochaetia bacterium]